MDLNSPSRIDSKAHRQKFGPYYLLAAGLVIVAVVLFVYPPQDKTVVQPVIAVAKPAPGLSLTAKLKSNEVRKSETTVLTFEASSDPGTLVSEMQVCVSAPEFTVLPADGLHHDCSPVAVFNKADIKSRPVPAEFDLAPRQKSGSAKLLVTASWVQLVAPPPMPTAANGKPGPEPRSCAELSNSCTRVREQVEMPLGPVLLGIDQWSVFWGRVWSFVKELTLPIILIFLPYLFAKRASAHEEEKQIAYILLPKVMRLAGRYYLPLTQSASKFVQKSEDKKKNGEETTFYLLSFFNIARTLKEQEGGVFFKDMAAEQIFGTVNNVVRALLVKAIAGEVQLMNCLDLLDSRVPKKETRWARFSDLPGTLPPDWTTVQNWLAGLKDAEFNAIRYLFNVVAATLRYEGNVPFAAWYSNSSEKELFELEPGIPEPPNNVFGDADADVGLLKTFKQKVALYQQGKVANKK